MRRQQKTPKEVVPGGRFHLTVSLRALPQPLLLGSVFLPGLKDPVGFHQKAQIGSWVGCNWVFSGRRCLKAAREEEKGKWQVFVMKSLLLKLRFCEFPPAGQPCMDVCPLFSAEEYTVKRASGGQNPGLARGYARPECASLLSFIKALSGLAAPARWDAR